MTSPDTLAKYLHTFTHLHRNAERGGAPHKPILLLAILHEIEAGRITQNLVPPSPELVAAFRLYWNALVPGDSGWQPRMATPFRYLRQEGFWELVQNGTSFVPVSGKDYSLSLLEHVCDGGQFADDLWKLLRVPGNRALLRQQLLATYFQSAAIVVTTQQQATYLYEQAEKLKEQAQNPVLVKRVRESREDEYYIRHRQFPEVIKQLYDFTCCVCRLSARMADGNSVIDGAHILPFAQFHQDHPCNGLALCKNHHWGFDCGAWSLTDNYRILVSPQLRDTPPLVIPDTRIHLPTESRFHPDPAALHWHRKNFGF